MFSQPPVQPPPRPVSRVRLPITRPLLAYILIGIIVAIFIVMELSGGSTNAENLVAFGANYAPYVSQGQYWRLVTANFLHIGFLHLAVNAYALYVLGKEAESLYGHQRFLVVYLLSGICGAIFSYLITQGLSAGASTSLFGLFGALAVFYWKQRKLLGSMGQQRLINLGFVLLINVFLGLNPGSGIDIWGHVGGFIGGVILAWYLCPVYSLGDSSSGVNVLTSGMNITEPSGMQIVDTNTLAKQSFIVGLFSIGLVVLTIIASRVQR